MNRLSVVRMTTLAALAVLLGWTAPVAAEVRYTVTDLSAIWQTDNPAMAEAIQYEMPPGASLNRVGQVVGTYLLPAVGEIPWIAYGFFWNPDHGLHDFGPASGVVALNDLGQILGGSDSCGVFLWSADDGMECPDSLQHDVSVLSDINNRREIVGGLAYDHGRSQAFTWSEEAGIRPLGFFGGDFSLATASNNAGKVIVWANDSSGFDHWCVWDDVGGMQDLGLRSQVEVRAINDGGQIVGSGVSSLNGDPLEYSRNRLLLWEKGAVVELENVDDGEIIPLAINNFTEVVGTAHDLPGWSTFDRAFLWTPTHGLEDLNALIPLGSPWQLTSARDVNDQGWILAQGTTLSGREAVLLLRPVPEPSTTAMIVFLFAALSSKTIESRICPARASTLTATTTQSRGSR